MSEPRFVPADLTELWTEGVLMAANERFFWPLGLGLTWTRDEQGNASNLHIRQWEWDDGHRETIQLSGDEIEAERHARFARWRKERMALLPEDERTEP